MRIGISIWIKGATAYELQIKHLYIRIVHLNGGPWKWRPWRRITIKWLTEL